MSVILQLFDGETLKPTSPITLAINEMDHIAKRFGLDMFEEIEAYQIASQVYMATGDSQQAVLAFLREAKKIRSNSLLMNVLNERN